MNDADVIQSEFDAMESIVLAIEEAVDMAITAKDVAELDGQIVRAVIQCTHLRGQVLARLR